MSTGVSDRDSSWQIRSNAMRVTLRLLLDGDTCQQYRSAFETAVSLHVAKERTWKTVRRSSDPGRHHEVIYQT